MSVKEEILEAAPSEVDRLMEEIEEVLEASGRALNLLQSKKQIANIRAALTKIVKQHEGDAKVRLVRTNWHVSGAACNLNFNLTLEYTDRCDLTTAISHYVR